jgi:hypothetical protein
MDGSTRKIRMTATTIGDQNEFAESGGSMVPPPDDKDHAPNAVDDHEEEAYQMKEREKWEVRELLRLVRDFEVFLHAVEEKRDMERRRNMTDAERLKEDIEAGRYRKPGEGARNRAREQDGAGRGSRDTISAEFTMKGSSGVGVSASAKASAVPRKKMPFYHRGAFYHEDD